MTPRFKVGLAVFGALALATAALWVALGPGKGRAPKAPPPTTAARPGAETGDAPLGVEGSPGELEGSRDGGPGTGPAGEPVHGGAVRPGLREPSGEDLSDPRVVEDRLSEALATVPVPWDRVADLLRVYHEPLDPDTRRRILEELQTANGLRVLPAIHAMKDGSFGADLLRLLDEHDLSPQSRQAVLLALGELQSGDREEVVRNLESRMSGDVRNDQLILNAIARRGGKEAARALVQYLQQSKDAARLPTHILAKLDLRHDREAARFVAESITAEQPPETIRALLDLAAKPGAVEVVEPMIALNREGVPDDVRHAAIGSLARVGSDKAVEYLLALSNEPGVYGELSLRAIGTLEHAPKESLDRLVDAARDASKTPRPAEARKQALTALGTMRHAPAVPLMGESLKDPSPEVRFAAVKGLGRVGKASRGYVPDLVTLYANGDDTMRRHVVIALGSIGGEASRSALLQMKGDASLPASLRRNVQYALASVEASMASDARPAPGAPGLGGGR
jgi:HEAT repeat protein